jgi:imidazolonepropionase-like amidohydrolase
MGTVEAGKNADLVLLDANPVESAANLHKIGAVVRGGFYFSAADLAAMKKKIADAQSKAAAG